MEKFEIAYNLAMDDVDPYLVKTAMVIADSKMTYEEKAEAIWKLFEERKRKEKEKK